VVGGTYGGTKAKPPARLLRWRLCCLRRLSDRLSSSRLLCRSPRELCRHADWASADNSQIDSNGGCAMDAKYFREKAELCLRLANGLSLNNPGRFQLMDLADDFLEKAKELKANKVKEESIRHEAA
jgi:hypothetical protein